MAAALLARRLSSRAVPAEVVSGGFLPGGHPVPPEVRAALAPFGADLSGHRSHRLTRGDIEGADLILTMTTQHLREAALLVPGALGRTFSLGEAVTRGEAMGPRPTGTDPFDWVAALSAGRNPRELLGRSPEDVADPFGGPAAGYRATATLLDGLLGRLTGLLWPAPAPLGSVPVPPVPAGGAP